MALVAGTATLLAAFPLSTVFASLTWLLYSTLAVALIEGVAMLVRTARGPVWTQVLATTATLLIFLTLCFPSGREFLRLFPTSHTFEHFNDLLVLAGQQIREESVPVPDLDGLLLLTTAGVGLVAILVDLAAVGLRRPALAGLPMLAIYSVPVAVLPNGVSPVPFVFAGVGFLWLLVTDSVDRVRRFGRRFTGEGRDVDVWEPSPLAAAGRRLGLVGLIAAIVLPVAVPGITSGLLDSLRGNGGIGAGNGVGPSGTTVDLSAFLTDQLLRRDKITTMVKVNTSDPEPFYLRFGVADTVQKNGFVTRAPSGAALGNIPELGIPDIPGVTGKRYRAEVEVAPEFAMPLAPAYQQVVGVSGLDRDWFYDGTLGEVFSRGGTSAGSHYTVDYVHLSYTPDALRTADALSATEHQLVNVPTIAQVTDLVSGLVANRSTEYDRVRAVYDYFTLPSNHFVYSVVAPSSKSGNPILDFLDSRTGFCTQYAAAMAWLVQVAGYPARVAFGFTNGAGPNTAGTYTLTNFNLHAWTEVYFPGFGWIPFDSTPAGSVTGSVQSAWAPDPRTSPGLNPSTSPGAHPSESDEDPNSVPKTGNSPNDGDNNGAGPPVSPWLVGAAAVITFALALGLTPALRRRTLARTRRSRSGSVIVVANRGPVALGELVLDPAAADTARRDAHEAWAELQDTMIDFNVPVDEAETPRSTAERLREMLGSAATDRDQPRVLARAEERARYARIPLRPDGLGAALHTIRGALALRATRWERFAAVVLPRSVLLHWRHALTNRVATMVATGARLRATLGSISPRRALSRATR